MVAAALALVLSLAGAGCLYPIEYQPADDAGVNHIPAIVGAEPRMPYDPTKPGGITISRSSPGESFTIDVEDRDLGDTLYVRVFRNYDPTAPTPTFANDAWVNGPGGSATRTLPVDHAAWCSGAANGVSLVFDILVADRPFVNNPTSQDLQNPDGAKATRSWVVVCAD